MTSRSRPRRSQAGTRSKSRRPFGCWLLLVALAVILFALGYWFGAGRQKEEADATGKAPAAEVQAKKNQRAEPVSGRPRDGSPEDPGTSEGGGEEAISEDPGTSGLLPGLQDEEAYRGPGVTGEYPPDPAAMPEGYELPAVPAPGKGARVAVVIDDLGRSLQEVATLQGLGVPISYAVLPFESRTPEVIARLRQAGQEILCHLPMEPRNGANPGPGALRTSMSPKEVRQLTRKALEATEGAVGVNNHMGSSLTADLNLMKPILEEIRRRRLFFLDSRTSSESVGYRLAAEMGLETAERQVFLDPDPSPEAIRYQFRRLLDLARRRGAAIAIGHPYPATLEVLAAEIPLAREQGYEFVPVSYLLDRTGELPE